MHQPRMPLSPHLQVYKPQLTSVLSILHRLTGVGLAVGAVFLAWWLMAAAAGPGPFEAARAFFASPVGTLVLFGFSCALFFHLCNGVRHLAWDAGFGFEIENVYRSGWTVLVAAVVLTFAAWFIGLRVGG